MCVCASPGALDPLGLELKTFGSCPMGVSIEPLSSGRTASSQTAEPSLASGSFSFRPKFSLGCGAISKI